MRKFAQPAIFLLFLLPAIYLAWGLATARLGPNPIEAFTHSTGLWALRFLLLTLAISPARRLLALPRLIAFRRLTGLVAFFYASLHFIAYIWLDQFFNLRAIAGDLVERRFIACGMFAFLAMVPLALTSTAAAIRRLGPRRWRTLHRLVYLAAIAATAHYYWLAKASVRAPVTYAVLLVLLLAARAVR